MRRAIASCVLLAALASGCVADDPTGIVIAISSDLSIPQQLDAFSLQVERDIELKFERRYVLDPAKREAVLLPATLTFTAERDFDRPLVIGISGISASKTIVSRTARVRFLAKKMLLLRLVLSQKCVNAPTCTGDTTCIEGVCQAIDIDPSDLPIYDQNKIRAADGGRTDQVLGDGPLGDAAAIDGSAADWGPCKHPTVKEDCKAGWCKVPAGCFYMGAQPEDSCAVKTGFAATKWVVGAETLHPVTLTRSFEIKQTEVTNAEYFYATGRQPRSLFCAKDDCPVAGNGLTATWTTAAYYCSALSVKKGLDPCYDCDLTTVAGIDFFDCRTKAVYAGAKIYDCPGYRLPMEAEWEYACRAGTTSSLYNGQTPKNCAVSTDVDELGWHLYNSNAGTFQPVGTKKPNAFGVYDMLGSVAEWVHDRSKADLGAAQRVDPIGIGNQGGFVMRGGSAFSARNELRASSRLLFIDTVPEDHYTGIRCVRTLP